MLKRRLTGILTNFACFTTCSYIRKHGEDFFTKGRQEE
jgi:hypothetical protein